MENRELNPADTAGNKEVELSQERTQRAAQRTRDAIEGTLMAWIRTALNMIGYGFGLFKLLQYMVASEDGSYTHHPASDLITMVLIGLGTLLLIGATVQYLSAARVLQREHPVPPRFPMPVFGAIGVALIGLLALVNLMTTVM